MYIGIGSHKEKRFSLCIYCLFIIFMILGIGNKKNYMIDELYSYGLANHKGIEMSFLDGKTYYPSNTIWIDYMTLDCEQRFDYRNVWKNQTEDVHPPLYYAVLHTICSFFPGSFSRWFAGIINIFFAAGTLFFVRKLAMLLIDDDKLQRIVTIAFVASAGILSAATFLRMYIMAMFWVTALTYLLLKQMGESDQKFYVKLLFCMVCGALTHYYFVLYAVFISVAYGICLLYRKVWKGAVLFCLTQGAAAVISLCVFPAMLSHIFVGYRGKEAFDNFGENLSVVGFERILVYVNELNGQLLGGIFSYIVVGTGIFLLTFGVQKYQNALAEEKRKKINRYFCLCFTVMSYFFIVSLSSAFLSTRYMTPVYAVTFLTIFYLISELIKRVAARNYLYAMILLTTLIIVNGLKNYDWNYLYYRDCEPLLISAREHGDSDCLYVYNKKWKILPAYCEASEYHSITFLQSRNLEQLNEELKSRYQLVVVIEENEEDEALLNMIIEMCPSLNTYEYIGKGAYTNSYYLYGK